MRALISGLLIIFVAVAAGCSPSSKAGAVSPEDVVARNERTRVHLENAAAYRAEGELGLALVEADQAVAADPKSAPAQSLRKEIRAARDAEAKAAAAPGLMWGQYVLYGPTIGDIISRSDKINGTIAAAGTIATTRQRGELHNMIDQAARGQAGLKREIHSLRVPDEAKALKDATFALMIAREEAMNKQKEALDKPSAATEGALLQARKDADLQPARVVLELARLCQKMDSPASECFPAGGFTAA
jgi:hypothetical protein